MKLSESKLYVRDVVSERQDEVVYYDAFESPDAMKGEEDPAAPPSPLRDEELCVLQQRTRQLEARRGRITAKKVYLKNKKVSSDWTRLERVLSEPVGSGQVGSGRRFINVLSVFNRKSVSSITTRRHNSNTVTMVTAAACRRCYR